MQKILKFLLAALVNSFYLAISFSLSLLLFFHFLDDFFFRYLPTIMRIDVGPFLLRIFTALILFVMIRWTIHSRDIYKLAEKLKRAIIASYLISLALLLFFRGIRYYGEREINLRPFETINMYL